MRTGPSGETIDTPRHRALGSTSRVAILRLVRAADAGMTAADVAERTGLHLSTTRAHLDRLVEAGLLIKARASGGQPGRPAWRYRVAAPEPAPAPYRALAAALLDQLATIGGGVPAAVRAGERWGHRLAGEVRAHRPATAVPAGARPTTVVTAGGSAGSITTGGGPADPVGSVLAVLTSLGFDPRRPTGTDGTDRADGSGDTEVHLHTCPFLELVGQRPDVMCHLHAGMIRGVLHAAGAAHGDAILEPFAAPTACVVRLRLSATSTIGGPR